MVINALLMGLTDNVVTCVNDVKAGETIIYRMGDEIKTLVAGEDIPYCHKIAILPIDKNSDVIKYDESIGAATEDISVGAWVSDKNVISVPRDYDSEMVKLS